MTQKKNEHCCALMDEFLRDKRTDIGYDPILREYSIRLKGMSALQVLNYCPWCGKKLPKDLGEKFFDILEKEYGIEHELDILKNPDLPKEFRSDEWWKKRGL